MAGGAPFGVWFFKGAALDFEFFLLVSRTEAARHAPAAWELRREV